MALIGIGQSDIRRAMTLIGIGQSNMKEMSGMTEVNELSELDESMFGWLAG